jgi:hypothetical protein
MLLHPIENQLHLPALFADAVDGQRTKREIIGQEIQSPIGFGIVAAHLPQRVAHL